MTAVLFCMCFNLPGHEPCRNCSSQVVRVDSNGVSFPGDFPPVLSCVCGSAVGCTIPVAECWHTAHQSLLTITTAQELYGEFLVNAQGEDVVAGIRTPLHIREMAAKFPQAYKDLVDNTQVRALQFFAQVSAHARECTAKPLIVSSYYCLHASAPLAFQHCCPFLSSVLVYTLYSHLYVQWCD